MRAKLLAVALGVASAATVATALADPPVAQPPPAQPDQAIFDNYSPTALTAGVGGEATLTCERTERGNLAGCRLLEETPIGQGFGAAALALASRSADGCGPPVPPSWRAARPIRFTFTASPTAIAPYALRPGWMVAAPKWRLLPNSEQFLRFYPERASRRRIQGKAVLQCLATADGRMSHCDVIAEDPVGYDFGKAAVQLSTLFGIDPAECDGHLAGATVLIPINFKP